jgi:hypothetical protein
MDIVGAVIATDYSVGPAHYIDLGAGRHSFPRMVSNGDGYLAVVHSEGSGESKVLAYRLDAAGNPLDAEPIIVATGGVRRPSVAWNGSVYWIVWQGPGSGLNTQIFAARMTVDGILLDQTPISIMAGMLPDVAAVGDTLLVVSIFREYTNNQYVTAVRVSGDGQVLGSPQVVGTSFARAVRVVGLGGRWLVVRQRNSSYYYDQGAHTTYANFVEADGTPGPSQTVGGGKSPHVAVAGADALIVFHGNDLWGRRIAADGTFLGSAFQISSAPNNQVAPEVAWNGSQFLVTWVDYRNGGNQWVGDVFAARVSRRGRVLDPNGFVIAASPSVEETPAVVAANGLTIFAYAGFNPQAPYANLRITLRTLTGVPLPSPGSGNQVAPISMVPARLSLQFSQPLVEAEAQPKADGRAAEVVDSNDGLIAVSAKPTVIGSRSEDWLDFLKNDAWFAAMV